MEEHRNIMREEKEINWIMTFWSLSLAINFGLRLLQICRNRRLEKQKVKEKICKFSLLLFVLKGPGGKESKIEK